MKTIGRVIIVSRMFHVRKFDRKQSNFILFHKRGIYSCSAEVCFGDLKHSLSPTSGIVVPSNPLLNVGYM